MQSRFFKKLMIFSQFSHHLLLTKRKCKMEHAIPGDLPSGEVAEAVF